MTVNFIGSDASGMVSYHADTAVKVTDLLRSAASDLSARAALLAWAKDVAAKAGRLGPDEAAALRGLREAVAIGELERASAIIAGKPGFFARFLSERVATFRSWTSTENDQPKEHQGGGWIVLPEGYAASPLEHRAPVLLPQGAAVVRTSEFQEGQAPPLAPEAQAAPAQRAHLPRADLPAGLRPKPAASDPWQAFAKEASCAGRRAPEAWGPSHGELFGAEPSAEELRGLADFARARQAEAPPAGVAEAQDRRAHVSEPLPKPAAAPSSALPCVRNCHTHVARPAVDARALPPPSPTEREAMSAWLRPDPSTPEGRLALGLPDPDARLVRPGDLLDDVGFELDGHAVILSPRHLSDPKLSARVEGLYGAIVEIGSAARLCDEATRQLGPGSALAKALTLGPPPPPLLARVKPQLDRARQAIRERRFDEAQVLLRGAQQTLKATQAAWARYGREHDSFLNKAARAIAYANYALVLIALAAAVPSGGLSLAGALGLEGAEALAFTASVRTAAAIGGLALEGSDIAIHAALGEPVDWARLGADAATALLLKRMGPLSNQLALRLLQDPKAHSLSSAMLTSLIGGALARGTHTAVSEVLKELGEPVALDAFMERVADRLAASLLNTQAIVADAAFGAASRPRAAPAGAFLPRVEVPGKGGPPANDIEPWWNPPKGGAAEPPHEPEVHTLPIAANGEAFEPEAPGRPPLRPIPGFGGRAGGLPAGERAVASAGGGRTPGGGGIGVPPPPGGSGKGSSSPPPGQAHVEAGQTIRSGPLESEDPYGGRIRSGPDYYRHEGSNYHVSAALKNGALHLSLSREEGAPFRGRELFNEAANHFGDKIDVIVADWDTASSNFKTYQALKPRLGDRQAALKTFTGKMAAEHGFTEVRIVSDEPDRIIVKFTKPAPAKAGEGSAPSGRAANDTARQPSPLPGEAAIPSGGMSGTAPAQADVGTWYQRFTEADSWLNELREPGALTPERVPEFIEATIQREEASLRTERAALISRAAWFREIARGASLIGDREEADVCNSIAARWEADAKKIESILPARLKQVEVEAKKEAQKIMSSQTVPVMPAAFAAASPKPSPVAGVTDRATSPPEMDTPSEMRPASSQPGIEAAGSAPEAGVHPGSTAPTLHELEEWSAHLENVSRKADAAVKASSPDRPDFGQLSSFAKLMRSEADAAKRELEAARRRGP